jgi:hypothetical protein
MLQPAYTGRLQKCPQLQPTLQLQLTTHPGLSHARHKGPGTHPLHATTAKQQHTPCSHARCCCQQQYTNIKPGRHSGPRAKPERRGSAVSPPYTLSGPQPPTCCCLYSSCAAHHTTLAPRTAHTPQQRKTLHPSNPQDAPRVLSCPHVRLSARWSCLQLMLLATVLRQLHSSCCSPSLPLSGCGPGAAWGSTPAADRHTQQQDQGVQRQEKGPRSKGLGPAASPASLLLALPFTSGVFV